MSRVDTAWLRMDTDANLMMIVGVWLLQPRLGVAELRDAVAARLLVYPRFRQKVVEDALGARWVPDEGFDLHAHVVAERLSVEPGQTPAQALQARVADLAATRLDAARPLWQMHLVEEHDGGSALIVRIHHCIGDGIALISVMLSIADGGAPPPLRGHRDEGVGGAGETDGELDPGPGNPAEAVLRPLTDLVVKALDVSGDGLSKALGMLAQGPAPWNGSLELARLGTQVMSDAAALALMDDDTPTRLKGRAQPGKCVAWGEPLPLDEVKAVGRVLGCSVNDVLLACVAGAIGHYLRDHGDDAAGAEIRALVPVNLRPLEQAWRLGNRFGLVPLVLPVGLDHPVQRVYEVHRRMAALKGSFQPLLAFGVLALSGLVAKPVQDAITGLFARKATAVMTNVPGPPQPLHFCGRTIRQTMFWVPQSGDIGMGVSVLSYAGGVQFGLITDRRLCPDPQAIVDQFRPAFDQLLWLALMLPWEVGSRER